DVSGGRADPAMAPLIAEAECLFIISHWRGPSEVMNDLATYDDVVGEVTDELMGQVDDALAAGVAPEQLIIDPGLGFAKAGDQNWRLLAALDHLQAQGFPLLIGASRKRFLGELLDAGGEHRAPQDRDNATAAITAIAAHHGVWGVRVHE